MISGATPGKGGRALSAHLLKAEKGQVTEVIQPRGIATREDLHAQLREIVAGSRHGRAGRPIYHVHCDPPPSAPDCQPVLDAWWRAFEKEFGLTGQPYCGAQHVKGGRRHEHRAYGLIRPDGRAVDVSQDFARRTYVNVIVGHALGLTPAPTPHARSVAFRLAQEGRDDVVMWMAQHGLIDAAKPVAPVTPQERLIESRTGITLAGIHAACLAAWIGSDDGPGFERELAKRGLQLRQGTAGPVVVDASGTAHSLTRAVGRASRERGHRIAAGEVKARLAGMELKGKIDGRSADRGARAAQHNDGLAGGADAGRGRDGQRRELGRDAPNGGRSSGSPGGRSGSASERNPAAKAGRRAYARARLRSLLRDVDWRAVREAERLSDRLEAISVGASRPAWIAGVTDIWGVPIS